jgi:hypothetical protein
VVLINYTNAATMRTYLGIQPTVTQFDELLNEAIESASREVDKRTRRYFGNEVEASTRTFDVDGYGLLAIDDAISGTIELDGYTGFKELPRNGIVDGAPGHPITRLEHWAFWDGCEVEVTARWGWEDVPAVVREATKMLAAETFMSKDTPLGYKGSDQIGVVIMRERTPILKKLEFYTRRDVIL